MFEGRKLVIATQHAKERAIAPLLEDALGVQCITADGLDTDALGTFTGEVERTLKPVDAAREKCRRAMDMLGVDLAVANEGSFGPHPAAPLMAGDDEMLVLVDARNDLELVAREVSAATNFAGAVVRHEAALLSFADKAGFPEHGLILRKAPHDHGDIHKGIIDRERLLKTFQALLDRHGEAYVETDMRANFNPSRMAVIAEATRQLVELAGSRCPQCQWPGFSVTEAKPGLPCELCGMPTRGVLLHVSSCTHCGYAEETQFPNGKTAEDPMYCDFCNP